MLGVAQKLFSDRYNRMPWQRKEAGQTLWPLLNHLLEMGIPLHVEVSLAKQMLLNASESAAAFLCHLCLATRQGHLCVVVDQTGVYPDPARLWAAMIPEEPTLVSQMAALIAQGSSSIPPSLIGDEADPNTPLIRLGSTYYLRRFWNYENIVAQQVRRLLSTEPSSQVELEKLAKVVENMELAGALNPLQAQAVLQACKSCLTIITGGPGTGKTYVAGYLIRLIWEALQDRADFEIVAAAPTGKATANLAASLKRPLAGLTEPPEIQSKTLHRLLGINKRRSEGVLSITADIIIVDESSMVDVKMMSLLLKATKDGARLILLGDSEQLPAVEAGGAFADLTAALENRCVVRLQHCLRTDSASILEAASAIRSGDIEALQRQLLSNNSELHFQEWTDGIDAQVWQTILQHTAPLLHYTPEHPEEVLVQMNRRRILTPLREGPWGVETVNKRLLDWSRKQQQGPSRVYPIMVTTTDYDQELFNGDVGLLVEGRDGAYALFRDTRGVRRLSAMTLPSYEYSFALSVHKSQGSEFDDVLLLLPPRSEVFGRELLYTAVTRAKKHLHIIGASNMLTTLVQKPMERLSGLRSRI